MNHTWLALALAAGLVAGVSWSGAAGPTSPAEPVMMFADTSSGRPFAKDPAVVRFQGTYWLYYSQEPYKAKPHKGWNIGVAVSDDLRRWRKAGQLAPQGDVEANGFCAPGAIVLGGRVHLFYQTYGNGRNDAICHATSADGLRFRRDANNPVFRPTGAWNCGRAIDADVIAFKGRLLMYWATRDPEMKVQMLGVSSAPLEGDFSRGQWTQLGDGPILKPELPWEGRCIEAPAACVRNGKVYMFYAGNYNNQPQQIGLAVSDDGVHFKRASSRPFLPNGRAGEWNVSESGHPFLFQDDDARDYLFFQGNKTGGKTWYLSMTPVAWKGSAPYLPEAGRREGIRAAEP